MKTLVKLFYHIYITTSCFTGCNISKALHDEDRCKNAQKLESAFYSREETREPEPTIDDKSRQLLELINQSPELAEILIKTLSA